MPDPLSAYAQSQPGKLAVIDDKPDGAVVRWTYAELEARANRVANLLLAPGAGPGTKVLWCGPNSPAVVAVINAARKIGAIAVPLNYRLTSEEARYVVGHSDAEIVYLDHEHAPMFAALRGRLAKVRHMIAVGGAEVTAFAREHLASYKVPRSVALTDKLPRTGSGKLLKRQLRAPYWAGHSS